jgi:hypothetical protein
VFLPIILIVAVWAIVASLSRVLTQLFGQRRRRIKRPDGVCDVQDPLFPNEVGGLNMRFGP